MFEFIMAWVVFILKTGALFFAVYLINLFISEYYSTRFDRPPAFLRPVYQIAASVSLFFVFFAQLIKAHAVLYQEFSSGILPWFGNDTVLFTAWLAVTFCSFAVALRNDKER